MKLNVYQQYGEYYYIAFQEFQNDLVIAEILSLTLEEYKNILFNYHACQINKYEDYYFYYQKDAKKAIKVLEPRVIMATLTE